MGLEIVKKGWINEVVLERRKNFKGRKIEKI